MKKKKSMSLFTKIYLGVLSCFLVLLIIAAFILYSILGAYEKTRAYHVAEDIFNKYVLTLDFGGLLKIANSSNMVFETDEQVNAVASELYDPACLKFFSVSTDENGNEKFAITSNDNRIAYFTVSPTDVEAGYGFNYCEVSDAELFFQTKKDVTIRVPKGYSLKVNDVTVESSYVSEDNIEDISTKYLPEGTNGLLYTDYSIKGLLFEPTITAFAPDGSATTVSYEEKNDIYKAAIISDAELMETQSEYIIKAASAYAAYMSNDAGFGKISPYLDKNSDIYDRVRTVDNVWVRDHSGYKISNEKTSEFHKYSDDVYTCRVTLKQSLQKAGYADHIENIDLILCMKKVDGKYLIYDIITNS